LLGYIYILYLRQVKDGNSTLKLALSKEAEEETELLVDMIGKD
jgi:hypothetical protein